MSDTVTGAGHTAGEFVREERYIVIKRKHLNPEHEAAIRKRCRLWGVPTVECVVVEDDWPEYETVWKMIEARVTGPAVSAAEGDLLGKMIEVIERAQQIVPDYYLSLHADLEAILSQAKAREVK